MCVLGSVDRRRALDGPSEVSELPSDPPGNGSRAARALPTRRPGLTSHSDPRRPPATRPPTTSDGRRSAARQLCISLSAAARPAASNQHINQTVRPGRGGAAAAGRGRHTARPRPIASNQRPETRDQHTPRPASSYQRPETSTHRDQRPVSTRAKPLRRQTPGRHDSSRTASGRSALLSSPGRGRPGQGSAPSPMTGDRCRLIRRAEVSRSPGGGCRTTKGQRFVAPGDLTEL